MFYRQKENKIISKILDHSGGVFSSGHGWGILGGRQGLESECEEIQEVSQHHSYFLLVSLTTGFRNNSLIQFTLV